MNHANRQESRNGSNSSAYIASFACVVPPYSADQAFSAELVKKHYAPQLNARSLGLIRATFSHPSIRKRHFAVHDPAQIMDETPDQKIARFTENAIELASQATAKALDQAGVGAGDVTCLVVNTCTGSIQKEGLFEPNKERFVPLLPLNIGLISSSGSAAYNDFIQTLSASGFGFRVHVADAMMQGELTGKSILRAIEGLSKLDVELIVIARGGGSKTDLYFLDNETIARKIASSIIPVWAGIGHEIDTSVLDYVANKSFKTPTAVAEELVARFVQMRRQLDESTNTLRTVWAYRYKIDRDYLDRAVTGIHQGPRKLLDVTASNLRERAQGLRHLVSGRLSAEHIQMEGKRGQLRTMPLTIVQKHIERLTAKGQNLGTQVKFALSGSTTTLTRLKGRFDKNRFIKRLQVERDSKDKARQQLVNLFSAAIKLTSMKLDNRKDRFRIEKNRQRILVERKSLNDKMATLRATDPQNALQRGFALVYRQDGSLIKSIRDIAEKDMITTYVADGSLISEVTAKESKRD